MFGANVPSRLTFDPNFTTLNEFQLGGSFLRGFQISSNNNYIDESIFYDQIKNFLNNESNYKNNDDTEATTTATSTTTNNTNNNNDNDSTIQANLIQHSRIVQNVLNQRNLTASNSKMLKTRQPRINELSINFDQRPKTLKEHEQKLNRKKLNQLLLNMIRSGKKLKTGEEILDEFKKARQNNNNNNNINNNNNVVVGKYDFVVDVGVEKGGGMFHYEWDLTHQLRARNQNKFKNEKSKKNLINDNKNNYMRNINDKYGNNNNNNNKFISIKMRTMVDNAAVLANESPTTYNNIHNNSNNSHYITAQNATNHKNNDAYDNVNNDTAINAIHDNYINLDYTDFDINFDQLNNDNQSMQQQQQQQPQQQQFISNKKLRQRRNTNDVEPKDEKEEEEEEEEDEESGEFNPNSTVAKRPKNSDLEKFSSYVYIPTTYVGCYSYSISDGQSEELLDEEEMSIDACIYFCRDRKKTFAALMNQGDCRCYSYVLHKDKTNEENCDMECNGNKHQICGGPSYLSVFSTCNLYFYGYSCIQTCFCGDGQCDFYTGLCPSEKCKQNFKGLYCDRQAKLNVGLAMASWLLFGIMCLMGIVIVGFGFWTLFHMGILEAEI
ncbi:hypothetical protein HELRODRAFT_163711 [Helobdella robusta]|uniref:WSC domain-containing protein n=1 Tax=Helobdella robusta TaxID=6412 RepID=T1EUE0_HELRO|nr:hypothetical protein HELRODRAFT_163711 [Helobdella robusta]ESN96622.1 hypothetical protein HELRODRAFT_163711 [Helobdella robusta]